MTDAQEEKFAGAGYSVGDWVEVQGPDSQWKLTYIKRIVKQAPDDWDWNDPDNEGKEPEYNFYYNCGEFKMLEEEYLRSPQEGLRRIFGMRPWVWLSYALLRYENFIRFQKNHENDFDEVDAQQYARNLWAEWLKDPRNGDFAKRYEEAGAIAQQEVSRKRLRLFSESPHFSFFFDFPPFGSLTMCEPQRRCSSTSSHPSLTSTMSLRTKKSGTLKTRTSPRTRTLPCVEVAP
jgi:hypothetical protein